ncbi:MAG: bifunctional metallophosphatase/5'-nucleotidase [Kofleriaceae bacterium]|jgi:5'-nucleotidase/UDP-sugar diphosphatase|nr:bifunctional metallophosphatase/5'-nucleotidase [Kofleriaceae bacterium]MBP6836865.1 bifunctional metallophosphatase/5'-nucleotidase [Kofleriaceae bacterium]MBP9205411.1 bifunctional metallophosphatase/5'-nucleotidase [Kofleriaceae bacterium]
MRSTQLRRGRPAPASATPRAAGLTLAVALGAGAGCTVQREQPNLVGQDIRLTFVHTSDIHSRLFPYYFVPNRFDREDGLTNAPFGGLAKMATIAKDIRDTSGRSLWLDSGDCFQGAPVFNMFKGEAEMRALSLAGMDAAVIGNHEFDLGSTNLFEQIDNHAGFPLLAANYIFEDPANPDARTLRDVVQPYTIFDADGLKVAVIGMANWSSMTGIFEGGNSLGLRPIDDKLALEQYVRLLRPSVDVIVVVSHLGLDEDEGLTASEVEDENESLPLEGVDIILGGHLHIVTDPPKIVPNDEEGHTTLLVHSGAFAKWVGRLDVTIRVGEDNSDPARRSRVTAFTYDNIPVDSKECPAGSGIPCVPEDPAVAELLLPYSVAINQDLDLDGVFAYVNPPSDAKIVRNDLSGGDSQLGNMVARSMQTRPGVEAEFALTNSLGVRADFERGPLTLEQMFNVFPFENSITVMYLSGTEIQQTLDFVARKSSERGCRTQAQVAGIYFDMVCRSSSCPDSDPNDGFTPTACAKNIYLGEDCRAGNPDGPITGASCRPVLPNGLYRVAVNDYISRGGSGFEVLKRNTSKQDTGVSLRAALQVFLRQQPTCGADVLDETDTAVPQRPVVTRWGQIPCLGGAVEPHDGRIRPVFED